MKDKIVNFLKVMKLFRECAFTFSKKEKEILIQCESTEERDELYEWLMSQNGNGVAFKAIQSGDSECFCWDKVPSEQR